MKLFIKYIIVLSCCNIALIAKSQERFNFRFDLGLLSCAFTGVHEVEDYYLIVGGGVQLSDSSAEQGVFQLQIDQNGALQDYNFWTQGEQGYILAERAGLDYMNSQAKYCYLGGTFDESTQTNAGFVASIDESGDTLAIHLFHSPYIELYGEEFDFIAPLDIEPSNNEDGSFFISSNIFVADQGVGNDCFISRMTPEGEILWEYIYSSPANVDRCYAMWGLENGGVLAAIFDNLEGTRLITLNQLGEETSFYESEIINSVHDIILDDDTNLVVASRVSGIDYGDRGRISKVNLEGEIIWETVLGTNAPITFPQYFTNIVESTDGNYVVGGIHYELLTTPSEIDGAFNENGWLVKISDDGEVIWDRKYHYVNSPDDKHTLNDLKATCDGGFIFCGEASDQENGTPFSDGPPQQGWLVKVDEYGCLVEGCQLFDSIQEVESPVENIFKTGPNPASQFLNIYQGQQSSFTAAYELYDNQGKLLESFPASECQTTMMLDVSKYSAGSYQLILRDGDEVLQSQKIIIE